jgi:hypothetical protein
MKRIGHILDYKAVAVVVRFSLTRRVVSRPRSKLGIQRLDFYFMSPVFSMRIFECGLTILILGLAASLEIDENMCKIVHVCAI